MIFSEGQRLERRERRSSQFLQASAETTVEASECPWPHPTNVPHETQGGLAVATDIYRNAGRACAIPTRFVLLLLGSFRVAGRCHQTWTRGSGGTSPRSINDPANDAALSSCARPTTRAAAALAVPRAPPYKTQDSSSSLLPPLFLFLHYRDSHGHYHSQAYRRQGQC